MTTHLRLMLLATRPWSFSMTAISVTLGSIAGLHGDPLRWGDYGLVLAGMILVHAASNLLNDYFDFRHGVDVAGAPTTQYRRHPLIEGDFTPRFLFRFSLTCYLLAALCGIALFLSHGWMIAIFAAIGGVTSIFYTAGPVNYKYRAMGEIAVFLMWGPLMVSASYFVQTRNWDEVNAILLISIPQGLWVALVLLANNLKDIAYDSKSDVKTLGTLLGKKIAIGLYSVIAISIYLITLLEIRAGIIPQSGFLTGLSLLAISTFILHLIREPMIPANAEPQTAKIAMMYGVLLIVAFLVVD